MPLHNVTPEAVDYFKGLTVGQVLPLKSFAPGLSKKNIEAKLIEVTKNKYWEFELRWHGVFIGNAYVERLPSGKLEFGEL